MRHLSGSEGYLQPSENKIVALKQSEKIIAWHTNVIKAERLLPGTKINIVSSKRKKIKKKKIKSKQGHEIVTLFYSPERNG